VKNNKKTFTVRKKHVILKNKYSKNLINVVQLELKGITLNE